MKSLTITALNQAAACASILFQIPTPPPGAIENWLIPAAAVASILLLFKKVLTRKGASDIGFITRAEFMSEINSLRDRIDSRFQSLSEKVSQMKDELLTAGDQRATSIHQRINELESGLARVDERTKR